MSQHPTTPTGPGLALVTGASTGIGLELARLFAADGFALLLAADEPGVHDVASELSDGGADATGLEVDLAHPDGPRRLHDAVTGHGTALTAVVLNAGIAANGPSVDNALADDLRVIDLDVRSTVHLARLVLPGLVARRHGRLLFVSSIAAEAPGPFQATYAASKAFVHSYAEALRHEVRGSGVTVTSLKPGPTDTAFFGRARMQDTAIAQGPEDDAARVARDGYDALMDGTDQVVAGSLLNRLQVAVARVVPDRVAARVASRAAAPGSVRDGS